MKKFAFISFLLIFLLSCSTSPDKASYEEAGTILKADNGVVISTTPILIKGPKSELGAATGAIIGGIAAKSIGSGDGKKIAQVVGAVTGGVIGYYSTSVIGEHNGFEYVIRINNVKDPVVIIQGVSDKGYNFRDGDKVTIIYGNRVRVVPARM